MDAQAARWTARSGLSADHHDPPESPESLYLGAPIQAVPELAAQSDPVSYLRTAPRLPAFSIAHGTADGVVPVEQSILLADALLAAGQNPQVTLLEGTAHDGARFDGELLAPTIEWLRAELLE